MSASIKFLGLGLTLALLCIAGAPVSSPLYALDKHDLGVSGASEEQFVRVNRFVPAIPIRISSGQTIDFPAFSFDGTLSTVRAEFGRSSNMTLEVRDGNTVIASDSIPASFYVCRFHRAGTFTIRLRCHGNDGTFRGYLYVQ
jgi:hypothetical protein